MSVDGWLTLFNYRCFGDTPVKFPLQNGFIAYLGLNNVGKSCLFRFLYEFRKFLSTLGETQNFRKHAKGMGVGVPDGTHSIADVFCVSNDRPMFVKIEINNANAGDLRAIEFEVQRDGTAQTLFNGRSFENGRISVEGDKLLDRTDGTFIGDYTRLLSLIRDLTKARYFPSKRTLAGANLSDTFDLQMGYDVIHRWDKMRRGYEASAKQRAEKLIEVLRRLFGFKELDITAADDSKTMHIRTEHGHYTLRDLGAGISEAIMMILAVASDPPSWLLIDEPELHLHASLQAQVLQVLASYCTRGVMFSTHSVGLTYHIATHKCLVVETSKGMSILKDVTSGPSLSDTLGAMTFSAWKEVGYTKILLVEGVSDVPLFQNLLALYGKAGDTLVWSLNGDSAIKANEKSAILIELKRNNAKIVAVIDSEKKSESEAPASYRLDFQETCKKLGIECHILKRRSTDHYLTTAAIRSFTKNESAEQLTPFQERKSGAVWGKNDNWRIARLMDRGDWDATDIGEILTAL